MAVRYTRANTLPGSAERKLVYAREYKARAAREREQSGVSYDTARKLRRLYPLSPVTKSQVKRKYGAANVTKQGTRYALTRAHIARGLVKAGKRVTTPQRQAIAAIKGLPDALVNPVDELGAFYHSLGMEMTGQPPMSLQEASRGWKETVGQEPGLFESFGFGGATHYSEGEEDDGGGGGGEWAREEEDLGGDIGGWADEMEAMYEDAYYDFEIWDAGEYSG